VTVVPRQEILGWLRELDPLRLERLWRLADQVRRANVGDAVHLRGLVELSNRCLRQCHYCGLWAGNRRLERYRMTADEVLSCARTAVAYGYGTVVLQAGEDAGLTVDWLVDLVRRITSETPLAITLSLGERSEGELRRLREAGADRYLLRFETSNRELFGRLHPPLGERPSDRIALLGVLRRLGYEVGSGVMVGLPGQSFDDLARDIELFRSLDLDMVGVGPYLPHPETPLGGGWSVRPLPVGKQVPNDELTTLKVVALTRLVCPRANIPSTTALATVNPASGRERGLERGANVVMPNLTPPAYRARYEIYPDKAYVGETAEACHRCLEGRIRGLGRWVGSGRGDAPRSSGDVAVGGAP
jgi:biotin synthase